MSSKRFWCMERQILRIRSEDDIQRLQILVASQSEGGIQTLTERLSAQIGELNKLKHNIMVAPDADAGDKLKSLMG